MGKKSKKKSRRKSSSSSSNDEDEKASKKQDTTKNCRAPKRKLDKNNQERCRLAAKEEKCGFTTDKNASQSTRLIKKPFYRLAKTQATDQTPLNKEEEYTKSKKASVSFQWLKCSSKVKNYSAKLKDFTDSGSKTVERGSTKSFHPNNACPIPQRTKEVTKGSLEGKSSERDPSKLKKKRMSFAPAEHKEQAQHELKRKGRAQEPPRTGHDSCTVKASEPSKTTSKYCTLQKRGDVCLPPPENELRVSRTPHAGTKTPSACSSKQSSTKRTTSVSGSLAANNVTSTPGNIKSVQHQTAKSSSVKQQIYSLLNFKIPKKDPPRLHNRTDMNNDAVSTKKNLKCRTDLSNSSALMSKQETVRPASSCSDAVPSFSSEGQDRMISLADQPPATVTEPRYVQMQVVEELHLARSERRLEVDIMQSYGELTCMDIDPPEEGAADTHCKNPHQQDLILVLDTNILLSHLDYVKQIRSHGLGAMGFPVVLIPWVVLQEMDSLKKGRGLSGSVAHLAIPAITYIYKSLKSREPRLWGQSMQQATASSNGLNAENNDDRVLQCCLQYQSLYPECAVILCTNDKNLCSKALLSGVSAYSKNDLEAEAGRPTHGFHPPQNIKPHISDQFSSPMQCTNYTPDQPHSRGLFAGPVKKDNKQLWHKEDQEKTNQDLSRCVSELEDCLQEVLSDLLEVEMKAAYDDLWLEIVYIKPPWSLQDVLQCLKKHWVAVFGQVVPRRNVHNVSGLISFFNSGKTKDHSATLAALREAEELVKAFGKRSSRIPRAISVMGDIFNKLQPQRESPACDVVMNEEDAEEKEPTCTPVAPQEVWALFENIGSNVFQMSMEVLKALNTMQHDQPVGSLLSPQDALAHLHKLSSMVSQLLQGFSSVLSSAPRLEEVQALLNVIHSNKIVAVDPKLTAQDLLDCFSQQEYREKLNIGGNQLMELKGTMDCHLSHAVQIRPGSLSLHTSQTE